MGVKIVMVFTAMAAASIVMQATSLFLPMTKVMFQATVVKLFTLDVKVLSYEIPQGSDVCTAATVMSQKDTLKGKLGFDICETTIQGSLSDVGQRMCSPVLLAFWGASLCESVTNAYYFGFMLVAVVALNSLLVLAASLLLFAYATSPTPKQQYRVNALVLHGLGTMTLVAGVLAYCFMVIWSINVNHSNAFTGLFLSANGAGGTAIGYFLLCGAAAVQVVMVGVAAMCSTSKEMSKDDLLDIKEQAKLQSMEAPSYGAPSSGYYPPPPGPVMVPQPLPYGQYQQPQYAAAPQAAW